MEPTIESELSAVIFANKVAEMDLPTAKAELIEMYGKLLSMEVYYKSALAHNWGIGDGL